MNRNLILYHFEDGGINVNVQDLNPIEFEGIRKSSQPHPLILPNSVVFATKAGTPDHMAYSHYHNSQPAKERVA